MVKASMSGGGVRGAEEAMAAEAADGLIATSASSLGAAIAVVRSRLAAGESPDLIALRRLVARALSPAARSGSPPGRGSCLSGAGGRAGRFGRPDRPGARRAAGADPKRAARSPGRGFLSRRRAAIVTGLPLDGAAYARAIVALAIVLMLLLAALWLLRRYGGMTAAAAAAGRATGGHRLAGPRSRGSGWCSCVATPWSTCWLSGRAASP